jgi:hypothetical protein
VPLRRSWTTFGSYTHFLKPVELTELGWFAVDPSSTLTSTLGETYHLNMARATAESDVDGAIGCPSQAGGGDPSSVPHKGPTKSWI